MRCVQEAKERANGDCTSVKLGTRASSQRALLQVQVWSYGGTIALGMPLIAQDLTLGDSPDNPWIVARCERVDHVPLLQMKSEQRLQSSSGLRPCPADEPSRISRQPHVASPRAAALSGSA